MSIQIDWVDDEKTIIQYHFERRWTFEDLQTAIDTVNTMLETVDYPVFIIINITDSTIVPSGILTQLRVRSSNAAKNWAGGVFVGANALVKTLLSTFIKVYPGIGKRYAVVETVDQALKVIAEKKREQSSS